MRGHGLLLGWMVLLAACAGPDPADEAVGEASAALSHEQAVIEALNVETALLDDSVEPAAITPEGLGWWMPRPLFKVLDRWGVPITRDCVHTTRFRDRDRDGLPDDATSTFDCVAAVDGQRVGVTGRAQVLDGDDEARHAGYTVRFRELAVTVASPNVLMNRTVQIDGDATVGLGDPLPGAFDRDLRLTIRGGGAFVSETVLTMLTDTRYQPAAGGRVDPFGRGLLRMRGRWTIETTGRATHLAIWTDPYLYYDRACAQARPQDPGFIRGVLLGRSDDGLVTSVAFGGCGTWRASSLTAP